MTQTYPPSPPTTSIHTTTGATDPGGTAATGGDMLVLGALGVFFFVLFIGTALLRYLNDKWTRQR